MQQFVFEFSQGRFTGPTAVLCLAYAYCRSSVCVDIVQAVRLKEETEVDLTSQLSQLNASVEALRTAEVCSLLHEPSD